MLYRPLRVFLPVVLVCLGYGLTKLAIDLARDPMISASALMALMSALMILLIGMVGDAIATRLGRLNQNAVLGVRTVEYIVLEGEELTTTTAPPPEVRTTTAMKRAG